MKASSIKIIVLFSLTTIALNAQHHISGKILADDGTPLPYANVLLKTAQDSVFLKGSISDETGDFTFGNTVEGEYYIAVSMVGFEPKTTAPFQLGPNQNYVVPTIILHPGIALDEVVVQSARPLYVQKIDRMVINVENSILASGSSALEVLERSPGVEVNRQGNSISVVGKSGVVVLINGKNSNMPQESILQLLEGMGSDTIESIELITSPPANFDAEGNAGFINIVLKKNSELGLNGSYSVSGGFGNGATTSDNVSLNYRKDGLNIYGNYSFLRNSQGQIITFRRSSMNGNDALGELHTISTRDPVQRNHGLRLGLDIELSDKTVLGALMATYDNKWTMRAINDSRETVNGTPSAFVELENTERNQWQHFGANINLQHTFEKGKSLNFDLDYLHYYDENPTDYVNRFFDGNQVPLREELTKSDKTTPINFFVGKTDYKHQVDPKLLVEAGAKFTLSNFGNAVTVSNFDGLAFIEDPTLTNTSNLDESIVAAYTSLDYTIDERTTLKAGLRYEHTDTELGTEAEGKVVDRNFGTFFPSAFISHHLNDTLSFNLSYSKRIRRPTFNNLAPFVIFIDPTSFITGNPELRPSISNAITFDTRYRSFLLSFQYSIIDQSISGFQPSFDGDSDRLLFKTENIDKTRVFSVTLGLPLTPFNWWTMQNNLSYRNIGVENNLAGQPLNLNQNNVRAFSTQSFTLMENLTSEINFNYYGPSLFASSRTEETFSMNLGFQKKFKGAWGTLRFSINDIWDSLEFTNNTVIPEQNINTSNTFNMSNRTFLLSYSRSFGNNRLRSSRQRGTGADEERRRVN